MSVTSPVQRRYDLTQRSQVSRAARELVRFMHMRNLGADDRLPPQSELVAKIEFSNDTISEAMGALVDAGVLTRKRRVGTVVSDPNRPVRGLWRVGVAAPLTIQEPFYAQLLHRVFSCLDDLGCTATLHLLMPNSKRPPVLADFGALDADVSEGLISGVISVSDLAMSEWQRMDECGIPICHVGAWEDAPGGAIIDQAPMAKQAVSLLMARGCRHLAMVNTSTVGEPGYNRGQLAYQAAVRKSDLGARSLQCFVGRAGSHGGARVADELLALPRKARPDGLVVLNDWVGMGLTARLAEAGSYRPNVVVQTNKQAPLAFAFPVVHFELDVEQLAPRCAEMLLQRMRNPLIAAQRDWVCPQLSLEEPSRMVGQASKSEHILESAV